MDYCKSILKNQNQSVSSYLQVTGFISWHFLYSGTFDVQNLLINVSNGGEACFQCIFMENSIAKGCFIVLRCIKNWDVSLNLTISSMQATCHSLHTCVYIITVYDIETDNTIHINKPPAYQTQVNITASATVFSNKQTHSNRDFHEDSITAFDRKVQTTSTQVVINLLNDTTMMSSKDLLTNETVNNKPTVGTRFIYITAVTVAITIIIIMQLCVCNNTYIFRDKASSQAALQTCTEGYQ